MNAVSWIKAKGSEYRVFRIMGSGEIQEEQINEDFKILNRIMMIYIFKV